MDEIMEEILALTKKKMREAGEYEREAFHQFLEETFDYYIEKGRLDREDDLDSMKEQLLDMYNDVEDKEAD